MPTGPIEIVDVQRTSISLRWKPPKDDGGSPIMFYIIEKKTPKSLVWSRVEKVESNTLEVCCINLYEKNEYLFRVIAENMLGQSPPLVTEETTIARSPFSKYIYVIYMYKKFKFYYKLGSGIVIIQITICTITSYIHSYFKNSILDFIFKKSLVGCYILMLPLHLKE